MRDIQRMTALKGEDPGPIDGVFGPRTKQAVLAALSRLPDPEPRAQQRTSMKGIAALAAHEGFVPGPYLDVSNVWTIYIGHTRNAGHPDPASMARGMPADLDKALNDGIVVFRRDLAMFEQRVRDVFKRPLKQHEFDAAVSFDYNTGRIHNARWVQTFNEGDPGRAADQIMNFRSPTQVIPRRQAEQKLFRLGLYPQHSMIIWGVTEQGRVVWKPIRTVPAAELEYRLATAS